MQRLKGYKDCAHGKKCMIELSKLPKLVKNKKKRLGQGGGSGKGKTAGRGTKGQKARGKIQKTLGIAGQSFLKRLPLYRGKYRNKPSPHKPLPINVKYLDILPKGSVIDVEFLYTHHIIDERLAKLHGVKILGDGKLTKSFTVKVPCSNGAKKKIEAAGGKVVYE